MNDDRLDSWKDIAAHFGRNIRTVQRWEKIEGLPIHRHAHSKRSSPFAYRSELDAWWASRRRDLEDAADTRFQDSESSLADAQPIGSATTASARRWPRGMRPGRVVAAAGALLLLTALTFGANPHEQRLRIPSGASGPVHWILVAEFAGPENESHLAVVVRELAISALAQSHIVTPISTLELRSGLQAAMLPDTTRVVGEVARQLAYRASARAYIEGDVQRIADGYFVVLRMIDAETGALRFSISDLAKDRSQLVPVLDRLGRRLRHSLGENQDVIRATRPFFQVTTPSFEAFRLYQASLDATQRDFDKARALQLAREAVAIDADFALAWWQLAEMALDVGAGTSRDLAIRAFEEARRRPDRLTEVQRLLMEAMYQRTICANLPAAYRAASEAVRLAKNYEVATALHSLGLILGYMGLPDEESACLARAASLSPFGLHEVVLFHLFNASLNQGRLVQAAQISQKLTGLRHRYADFFMAQASLDWPRAEKLGCEVARDPLVTPAFRLQTLVGVASAQAAQGRLGDALRQLETVDQDSTAWYWPWFADFVRSFLSVQLLRDGAPQAPVAIPEEATTVRFIELGLLAAVRVDTLNARRALEALRSRRTAENLSEHAVDLDLLEAWIAFDRGAWAEAVRILEPIATNGLYLWPGRVPCRWLVAAAYEQLGDLAKAATYLELALVSRGTDTSDRNGLLGFVSPFARARLVSVYSSSGRNADARRHWKALQATCADGDRDLMARLEQTGLAMSSPRPGT